MKTTEYLMMRRLDDFKPGRRFRFKLSDYEIEDVTVRILEGSVPFGSFKLLPYSNGDVYFYEFELFPENRGHREGTAVFPHILTYLYRQGYKNIRLQVSSSNPAALSLYNHFDFEVIESVSF